VNCSHFALAVSFTLKTKIRYNGQEYSSPAELPPEVRAAYENAVRGRTAGFADAIKKTFVVNGQKFASENEMPADVRKLCDDVMNVIENNGEVTIPNGEKTEPLLTKKEIVLVAAFAGGIAALVVARLIFG
jgi:hypothetical protein